MWLILDYGASNGGNAKWCDCRISLAIDHSLRFLGALTTFSTFSMDNVLLMQQGAFFKMGLNVLLNVFLSISAAWVGYHFLIKN